MVSAKEGKGHERREMFKNSAQEAPWNRLLMVMT